MTILLNKKFKTNKPFVKNKDIQKKLNTKRLKNIKSNTISTSIRTLLMY
jgi:hypothetical protein